MLTDPLQLLGIEKGTQIALAKASFIDSCDEGKLDGSFWHRPALGLSTRFRLSQFFPFLSWAST